MIALLRDCGYEPEFQVDIPRFVDRPFYRTLSLFGIRPEALIQPFDGTLSYIPAVIFAKSENS